MSRDEIINILLHIAVEIRAMPALTRDDLAEILILAANKLQKEGPQ